MEPITFVGLDMHKRTTSVAIAEPGRGGELGEGIAVVWLAPGADWVRLAGRGRAGWTCASAPWSAGTPTAPGWAWASRCEGPRGWCRRDAPAARPAGGARTRCSSWPARRGRSRPSCRDRRGAARDGPLPARDRAEVVGRRRRLRLGPGRVRVQGPLAGMPSAAVPVALWQRCALPTRSHGELAVHVRHAAAAGRHTGRRGTLATPG